MKQLDHKIIVLTGGTEGIGYECAKTYVSVIMIVVLTGIYTIIGGLRTVVITEAIQTIVLFTGAIIITVILLIVLDV